MSEQENAKTDQDHQAEERAGSPPPRKPSNSRSGNESWTEEEAEASIAEEMAAKAEAQRKFEEESEKRLKSDPRYERDQRLKEAAEKGVLSGGATPADVSKAQADQEKKDIEDKIKRAADRKAGKEAKTDEKLEEIDPDKPIDSKTAGTPIK